MSSQSKIGAEMVATSPAMLDARALAALLMIAPGTVYRLAEAGRIPKPARVGSLLRWSRVVIDQWIADGCPPTTGRVSR